MIAAEHESDFILTTDTPYLALTGDLLGVFCEDIGENWPHYYFLPVATELIQS